MPFFQLNPFFFLIFFSFESGAPMNESSPEYPMPLISLFKLWLTKISRLHRRVLPPLFLFKNNAERFLPYGRIHIQVVDYQ